MQLVSLPSFRALQCHAADRLLLRAGTATERTQILLWKRMSGRRRSLLGTVISVQATRIGSENVQEATRIGSENGLEHNLPGARQLRSNFVILACCFGVNHGAQTSVLTLASSLVGDSSAGISSAALFAFYTAVALLFSAPCVQRYGPRAVLMGGMLLAFSYVLSFILVLLLPRNHTARDAILICGGICAGVAAALVWTAQGIYFKRNASVYALRAGITSKEANLRFSGTFARIYLGMEMVLKLVTFGVLIAGGCSGSTDPGGANASLASANASLVGGTASGSLMGGEHPDDVVKVYVTALLLLAALALSAAVSTRASHSACALLAACVEFTHGPAHCLWHCGTGFYSRLL